MSQTMTFSDIEWGEVVSTRVYEDAFPNELSEISNIENYLIPTISGSITSQTVDLVAIFELSHSRDDVPAEFDKLTTIEDGEIVTENLLATTQSISIPGTYSINDQGFDSYSVEAIKSAPAEGTYWLNDLKSSSLSVVDQEGYYLYLDTSDDSIYETVIVMDKYDNVVGIGFDYDLDSRFHPGKTLSVEKSIIWSEKYGGDSITDDYIHFRETDKEVGVFNEPTFTDVLFDVGRMVFAQNNELMTLAEDMATNQFDEQINLVEDVFIQTIAGLVGYGAGILASYAGMSQLGYMLGYLAVMIPYQMVKILEQENYFAHRTFRSDDFADEKVLGEKFWFDDMYGDIMPITMFGSFGGVYAPVYGQTDKHSYSADVLVREFNFEESKASSLFTSYNYPKLDYWLSTRNVAGYSDFDESIVIGYLQSTGIVNPFIFGFGIPEYNHAKSSVYYLENQVQKETDDKDDAYLNTIVPTIDYDYANDRFSPRFSFVDSTGGFPAPEFYTEYPVIVSEDSSAVNQYCSIYKLVAIGDPEETTSIEIQLFDAGTKLEADIVEIDAYLVWTQTIYPSSQSGSEMSIPITTTENSYVNTMTAGEFEVDLSAGTVTISSGYALSTILNSYVTEAERLDGDFTSVSYSRPKIVFQVKIEKYRSISDVRDLTQEQVNKIATAQAIEAAILEYNYQFNLATQTQLGFHEIIYTATVTLISTVLTMAATYAVGSLVNSLVNPAKIVSNKFIGRMLGTALQGATSFTAPFVARAVVREIGQELLLDPWIESTVSGLVRRAGGDAIMQMVLSSIAESGREALSGPLTNIINPQQASFMSDIESDYFAKGRNPTIQDVLTAFNEYRTKIIRQQEQRRGDLSLLGGATRALSFVSLAIGFTTSQFLGPVGALMYSTLVVYCFSEDISLKSFFSKVFNPVTSITIQTNPEVSDPNAMTELEFEGYMFAKLLNPGGIVPSRRSNVYLLDNYNPSQKGPVKKVTSRNLKSGDLEIYSDALLTYFKFLKSFLIDRISIPGGAYDRDFEIALGLKPKFFISKAGKIKKGTNLGLEKLYLNLLSNIKNQLSPNDWLTMKNNFEKVYILSRPMINFKEFSKQMIVKHKKGLETDLRFVVTDRLKQIVCSLPGVSSVRIDTLDDLFYGGKRFKNYAVIIKGDTRIDSLLKILYYNDVLTRRTLESKLNLDLLNLDYFLQLQKRVRKEVTNIIFENNYYTGFRENEFYRPEFELFLELWLSFSVESGKPLSRVEFYEKIECYPTFAKYDLVGVLRWRTYSILAGTYDGKVMKPGIIHTALSPQNSIRASEALARYGFIRDIWKRSDPKISFPTDLYIDREGINQYLGGSDEYRNLRKYILESYDARGELPNILEGKDNYYRSSSLNSMLFYLSKTQKQDIINKLNQHITSIAYQSGSSTVIQKILDYAQVKPKHSLPYPDSQLTGYGGAPHHKWLLRRIINGISSAIASEVPFYFLSSNDVLTGHPDLILFIDGTLYICDYKPNYKFKGSTGSTDFVNAIPQLSSYALMISHLFGIKNIKCLIFNKEGAKIFSPNAVMTELTAFLAKYKAENLDIWSTFL